MDAPYYAVIYTGTTNLVVKVNTEGTNASGYDGTIYADCANATISRVIRDLLNGTLQ